MFSGQIMVRQLLSGFFYWTVFIFMALIVSCQTIRAESEGSVYSGIKSFGDLLLPTVSHITIGSGISYGPDYIGSDDFSVQPKVVLYIKFKDFFILENEGIAINILGMKNFQFGPIIHFTGPRRESSNTILQGLGDIKGSLDLGVYAKVTVADRFVGRVRLFNDMLQGKNGSFIEFSVSTLLFKEDRISTALSVDINWVDTKRARRFYGISPTQSKASGLAEYAIRSSFQDTNITLATSWKFSQNWSLNGYGKYTRMLGQVADSPLVKTYGSANQFSIGSFVSYTFGMD